MKDRIGCRKLDYSDINKCLEIMKQCFPLGKEEKFWTGVFIKDLTDILNGDKLYNQNCLVVTRNETEIIGFGCYMQSNMAHNIYELTWISISPENQNKGIGKYLVVELEKDICKGETKSGDGFEIMFETHKPYFYEKLGYKSIYKTGGDNIIMIKSCSMNSCVALYTEDGYGKYLKKEEVKNK